MTDFGRPTMDFNTIVLGITIVVNGLVAGLFWGWTVSVIPGTKNISDLNYVETMQTINRDILNPWFLGAFMGGPILLVLSTILYWNEDNFTFILLGAITIIVGQFVVTAGRNVPLNNRLEAEDLDGITEEDAKRIREYYEGPWNFWQYVRTWASFIGLILLIVAVL